MPELVADLAQLPPGTHCLSLQAGREEGADRAVSFLAGAPPGQPTSFWVADSSLKAYYEERLAEAAPDQVGCVRVLDREQVEEVDGALRPVAEIAEFVAGHPDGVSGGADTIDRRWDPATLDAHLEYEAWFDRQPRAGSRFLCPYDLRRIPLDAIVPTLRALGRHHSHASLSDSDAPAVRLLQLFVFPTPGSIPRALRATFDAALRDGLVATGGPGEEFGITERGRAVVAAWRATAGDAADPAQPTGRPRR